MLLNMEMSDFFTELASASPAPGGGSVAAISGALGAALLSMVCRLTIGKKGYEDVDETMREMLQEAERLSFHLQTLIDKDSIAFNQVMAAFKLPQANEVEKEQRSEAIQQAFKKAADVPFSIAAECLMVLEIAHKIVNKVNKNAISDIGVATLAAYTGLEGAVMNVRINLPSIKDIAYVTSKKEAVAIFLQSGQTLGKETGELISHLLD